MNEYDVCTDFVELMCGTSNKTSPAYMEAARSVESMDDSSMKKMRDIFVSMDKVMSDNKSKEPTIAASKGVIENFKGYDNIKTVMGFLTNFMPDEPMVKDLQTIKGKLEEFKDQYSEAYRTGLSLMTMEYDNAAYLLVTGLTYLMSTKIDVNENNANTRFLGIIPIKKKSHTNGLIPKLCHELAAQLGDRKHKEYLDGLIKANSEVGSIKESADMDYFSEGWASVVGKAFELISSIGSNISNIGRTVVNTFKTVKNTVFGIVPLIRSIMYLKYKKKADTVLALEQQARFIQMNIDQLENIKDMDPDRKSVIIKKQKAYIEQYRKKAEKLRAQLCETEKDAADSIKKADATPATPKSTSTNTKSNGDFVLEQAGFDASIFDTANNEGTSEQPEEE